MSQPWRWLLALLVATISLPVAADELRPAVIELAQREQEQWSLEWKLPVSPAGQGRIAPLAAPVIPTGCEASAPPVRRAFSSDLLGSVQLSCPEDISGSHFGLTELVGSADAIARYVPLEGAVQTFRLTSDAPTAIIAARPDPWAVARDYFFIGADHILMGWDHLLFVILLVLLVRSGLPVVAAATAFTIAHSITLVATTLGLAGLPSAPVEALIALSIVFLAVEVIRSLQDPEGKSLTRRVPWLVAFVFGLLHGFGFAGALAEIGLPRGEIAMALLAFNIGVEVGQGLVILLVLGALAVLKRKGRIVEKPAIHIASYAMGIAGSFWLIERVVGWWASHG